MLRLVLGLRGQMKTTTRAPGGCGFVTVRWAGGRAGRGGDAGVWLGVLVLGTSSAMREEQIVPRFLVPWALSSSRPHDNSEKKSFRSQI